MVVLSNLPPPEEGVRHKQPNTHAFIETRDLGSGTLYVAESRLTWTSHVGTGFSLEYPAISLHAISRDHRVFPGDCVYLMVEADLGGGPGGQSALLRSECDSVAQQLGAASFTQSSSSGNTPAGPGGGSAQNEACTTNGTAANSTVLGAGDGSENAGSSSSSEDMDEDSTPISEIRFVPDDSSALDVIFQTMSECQALHPDPEGADSDDEHGLGEFEDGGAGMGDFFSTADAVSELTPQGRAQMERLNAMLNGNESAVGSQGQDGDHEMEDDAD